MQEHVRGFVIQRKFALGISLLSREQKGLLLEALFADMGEGEAPDMDPVTRAVFSMMLPSVHEAQDEFRRRAEISRENGRLGGRPRKRPENRPDAEEAGEKPGNPQVPENPERKEGKGDEASFPPSSLRSAFAPPEGEPACLPERAVPAVPAQGGRRRPTPGEVRAYCEERGNGLDAGRFCDYYAAQGWKLANGRPLRDWKAAVRNWENRERGTARKGGERPPEVRGLSEAERRQAHNDEVCRRVAAELDAAGGPF